MQGTRYRIGRRGMKYRVNKKRIYPLLALISIFIILLFLNRTREEVFVSKYRVSEFTDQHLEMYFDVGASQGVPWYYLASIDKAEQIPEEEISSGRSGQIALHLRGISSPKELGNRLKDYTDNKELIKGIEHEIKCLQYIMDVYDDKVFPISDYEYTYSNDYGNGRSFGGDRKHEGIDIMCDDGTPLLSVCDGVVEKKGWLELGGWRIGIRGNDGVYYYYAHLSRYEDGLEKGHRVKKGQVIGYAGDTGYGVEGTTGQFEPHLHFGMYERDGWTGSGERATNPYPFLRGWERN
ncbi:MAG TPA: M23 family metallopeptidase [Clostridia bacterium]|nr:M23 family metallopeptidase [Clostridia bacterium]